LYKYLALKAHRKDGYINVYFHPWEFTDLNNKEKFGFPAYVSENSGEKMTQRFDQFLKDLTNLKLEFNTLSSF
jgi:hypothetical protein